MLGLSDLANERLSARGLGPLPTPAPLEPQFINPDTQKKLEQAAGIILPGFGAAGALLDNIPKDIKDGIGGAVKGVAEAVIPGAGLFGNLVNNWDNGLSPAENIRNWLLLIFFAIMILIGVFGLLLPEQTTDAIGTVVSLLATKGAV